MGVLTMPQLLLLLHRATYVHLGLTLKLNTNFPLL